MTKAFTTFGGLALLVLMGFAFRTYNQHQAIERELARVRIIEQEIKALEAELEPASEFPADLEEQIESLEKENRALHRLRNEVQQLRQQTNALNQLRIKNQQLVQTLQRSNERGSLDAASLGFVSNEQWKDVGTNTPKQALTTFFYYLSQGDLRALVSRSTLDQAEQEPFENASPEDLEKAAESMRNFTKEIKSFRVQQLNQHDESHITVQIQTAFNGETVPIKLLKQDKQWRFDMEDGAKFF
jgi:septal ring factor EnvC (AmiA/AmiB activator)